MSSKVDPRGITDDFIDREVKMTWKDSLYSVYLFFRLGEAAASRKCLYINYTTLDKKSYAMGTVMDLEDVPPLPSSSRAKRLCFISDTHEKHHVLTIPKCDVLIHTGDILFCGRKQSPSLQLYKLKLLGSWLGKQQAKHRLLVGGNHDKILEELNDGQLEKVLPATTVLHNKKVTIEGLCFYGSPFSSGLSKNRAFQGDALRDKLIEDIRDTKDIDVLLTHGDDVNPIDYNCTARLHSWGHHHTLYGAKWLTKDKADQREGTLSICSTIMDKRYRPIQLPIVVDLEPALP